MNTLSKALRALKALFHLGGASTEPSIKDLLLAAEGGDSVAQTLLATKFHEGEGVERSPKDAFYWWQQAAFNDHPGAQAMLGVAYHTGVSCEADLGQAAQWVMRSARQGNEIGVLYWDSLSKELTDTQYEEAKVQSRRPLARGK